MKATMSITGLYNYDNTIFDDMVLPEEVEKETVIDLITSECAEMELLYPSATYLKHVIGKWSAAMLPGWNKALKALTAIYNPIENYDRYEEIYDVSSENNGNIETATGNTSETRTPNVTSTTNHNKVAYDINQYDKERQEVNTQTGTDSTQSNNTARRENTETRSNSATHTAHIHGNIGVVSADQMIAGALETAKKSIYMIIVQEFKDKFCLLVY